MIDLPMPAAGKPTLNELGHRSMILAPPELGGVHAGGGEEGVEDPTVVG
jgi:hypothetical protein